MQGLWQSNIGMRRMTSRNFEQYKRMVKFLSSAIIVLLELTIYYYVWINYYNKNMTIIKVRKD